VGQGESLVPPYTRGSVSLSLSLSTYWSSQLEGGPSSELELSVRVNFACHQGLILLHFSAQRKDVM